MVLKIQFVIICFLLASCAGNNGQGENIRVESMSGDQLFSNNCSACHGVEGDAGVGGASDLKSSELDHFEVRQVIEKGRKAMPPQTHAYDSSEELDNLVEHVISLRK